MPRLKFRSFVAGLSILVVGLGIFAASFLFLPPPEESLAVVSSGVSNPTCLDNYETWSTSTTFKADADWSTAFMADSPTNPAPSNFNDVYLDFSKDLNGDGLPDYTYVSHGSRQYCVEENNGCQNYNYYVQMKDCVYLSNGSGWDLAYRCVSAVRSIGDGIYEPVFYGDCADV